MPIYATVKMRQTRYFVFNFFLEMFPEESSLSVQIVVPLLKVIGISTFNVKIFFERYQNLG